MPVSPLLKMGIQEYLVSLYMLKNLKPVVMTNVARIIFWKKYKKPIIITTSVLLLQLIFGFDPKFCIINIIWLFV